MTFVMGRTQLNRPGRRHGNHIEQLMDALAYFPLDPIQHHSRRNAAQTAPVERQNSNLCNDENEDIRLAVVLTLRKWQRDFLHSSTTSLC